VSVIFVSWSEVEVSDSLRMLKISCSGADRSAALMDRISISICYLSPSCRLDHSDLFILGGLCSLVVDNYVSMYIIMYLLRVILALLIILRNLT
jgi:hypothetical protein